jgi:mono/diheme cytochrome c family protein
MLSLLLLIACGPDLEAGAATYDASCAACHGADGKLGLETSGVAAADLTVEVPEKSDEALTDIILNGYGEMPPQGLDEARIVDLLGYLRETFPG